MNTLRHKTYINRTNYYCTIYGKRPISSWAQIKVAHEQYPTLGPPSIMANLRQPKDTNLLFGNSMHGKKILVNSSLSTAIVQLYRSVLGVPWEVPLPSNVRRLAPVPTSKLLFLTQSIFFSRIIKLGPPMCGAKRQSLAAHYHQAINTRREEEKRVRH